MNLKKCVIWFLKGCSGGHRKCTEHSSSKVWQKLTKRLIEARQLDMIWKLE